MATRTKKVKKVVYLDCGAVTVTSATEYTVDEAIKRLKRHDKLLAGAKDSIQDLKEIVDQASPRLEDWPADMDIARRRLLHNIYVRTEEMSRG